MAARKKATAAPTAEESAPAPGSAPSPAPAPVAEMRLTDPLPTGRFVVEASAGTGKTYSLTALVVRHLAMGPLEPRDILVVTFTRAAAAELRDRMRRGLVDARAALEARAEHDETDWLSTIVTADTDQYLARRERLDHAIANFDEATISTIHGFCQQALTQLGLRSGALIDSELHDSTAEIVDEVCRDLLVQRLWNTPSALSWLTGSPKRPADPNTVLERLVEVVTARLGNPGIHVVPTVADIDAMAAKKDVSLLRAWVATVDAAVAEVERRRRARGELGYDDLVVSLHRALTVGNRAPAVAAALRERYSLVLVDEFQDTDPLQWAIFETAFTGDLVTVGDPKQAIYRFRGADVHAYLAATATGEKRGLRKNFRSDRDLVAATNVLVEGVELGHGDIVAEAVSASDRSPVRALDGGAPLMVRHLRFDPSLGSDGKKGPTLSSPLARRAILADLVRLVVAMLDGDRLHAGTPAEKRVSPGDIAVLVPSHRNADDVVRALAAARIPAVRARTGSVFLTPAAAEWRLLLAALERPSHAPTVRAAALGLFLYSGPSAIDPMAAGGVADDDSSSLDDVDAVTASIQRRCAEWAQSMGTRPFLAWYDTVRAESGLVEHLMSRVDGERVLTDLDHIAELLATDSSGGSLDPTTARRRLDHRITAAESMGDDEAQMRRIDSDAAAVQVSTVHGSKGLEYPIVLLPFSWTVPRRRGPRLYNRADGRRVLDVASALDWDGPETETRLKARRHYDSLGRQGDQLRLMYVALTRAEHRTVLWVAQYTDSKSSALNVMLFDRDESGAPLRTRPDLNPGPKGGLNPSIPAAAVTDDQAAAHLSTLAARSGGTLSVSDCPPSTPPVVWEPVDADDSRPAVLSVADPSGCEPRRPWWRRWSFSTVVDTRGDHSVRMRDHEPAVVGGADEPDASGGADGADDAAPAPGSGAAPEVGSALDVPLADAVAGAEFGTLVHEVLEQVDPTTEPLEPHLRAEIDAALGRDRLAIDRSRLADGLAAAIRTPLGWIAGGRSLADIPVRDRLAELDFEMSLRRGDDRFAVREIGEVLLGTLPDDDPQRRYGELLAAGRFDVDLGGYLRGSIDAVLRVEVGGETRHLVVDYKTNRLHERGAPDPLAAYHPGRLPSAMATSDYVLQGLLYSVAVHRFLRRRIAGYDPAVHLGGIGYLYVRGMIGPATPVVDGVPYGVFAWRPPASTIVALDALFATGVAP